MRAFFVVALQPDAAVSRAGADVSGRVRWVIVRFRMRPDSAVSTVRFDERTVVFQTADMKHADLIEAIRMAYPQIWFACHIEHRTRGQDRGTGLTDREAGLLAHVGGGQRAGDLAAHLGIGKAALSQHLKSLTARGLIATRIDPADRRQKIIELTKRGRAAAGDGLSLDASRLGQLLDQIPVDERGAAVAGLERLAEAARCMRSEEGAS